MKKDDYEEDYEEDVEEDIIDSPMEIGGQIHTQSEIIRQSSPHLPKDTKYSKFNNIDVANYMLNSRTYSLWRYIKKIEYIANKELISLKGSKKSIYYITTAEELKKHLESIGKVYVWQSLSELPDKEMKEALVKIFAQLKEVNDSGVIETMYAEKDTFYDSYGTYLDNNEQNENYDDFGLMNKMLTITEVKKAHKGWGMDSMNTTINITKSDENLDNNSTEYAEDTEAQQPKKGFFKK